jgi:Putative phage tail protein
MGQLALGVAGAAIGSFFGMPAVGWAVGSALGGYLFQDKQEMLREGPRLNDLRVQASTYGVGIPIVGGTVKMAGNLIWCGGIREITTESQEEVGKGGGQDVTTKTYSYIVSFAIGLCKGPIGGIRRIWADGELIFDANNVDLNSIAVSTPLGGMTIYPGDEAQLPDGTIESYQGVGNVPAHRGMAYAVFADADVTKWGRIPNLEFEVLSSGTTSIPSRIAVSSAAATHQGYYQDGLYYTSRTTIVEGGGTSSTVDEVWTPAGALISSVTKTSTFYFSPYAFGGITGRFKGNVPGLCYQFFSTNPATIVRFNGDGTDDTVSWQFPAMYYFGGSYGSPRYLQKIGDVCLTAFQTTSTTMLLQFRKWDDASDMPQPGPFKEVTLSADFNDFAMSSICSWGEHFFLVNPHSGGVLGQSVKKYDTSGALVDSWTLTGLGSLENGSATVCGDLVVARHGLAYSPYAWVIRLIPGGTFEEVNELTSSAYGDTGSYQIPSETLAWNVKDAVILIPSITSGTTTLSAVVTAFALEAGLSAADIDVSALTDTINGYVIGRPMTARAAIEILQKAFFFDGVESDGKIKFVKRGGASAVTIPAADLGATEPNSDAGDLVSIERGDETEAPRQIVVSFWNKDGSYSQATEYARRLVVRSVESVFETLPLVLSPNDGARIADVLLYAAHMARTRVKWATGREYAKYEPTDVVTLTSDTMAYLVRILKRTDSGARIEWEGQLDDAPAYSSSAPGATVQTDDTTLATSGPAILELMDIPILRDMDDNAGFYAAMTGVLGGWHGGVLFGSADDVDFAQLGAVSQGAAIGVATSALGNFQGGNVFDELSTVTVQLTGGSLSSATEAAVCGGSNWALLGSEIIAFKNATLVTGTTYRLTGMLRGRFGTESGMTTHVSGERFVLLLPAGMIRPDRPASELNVSRYYRGVSYGQAVSSATSKAFANSCAGLKPLPGVYLRGFRNASSDLSITWVRRTRVGGDWRDFVDASLGETTESYEVDIRNAGNTATLRTIASSTPSVTYTAAQQTTDFGSPQSSINVRVYQLSSVVGRGFPVSGAI